MKEIKESKEELLHVLDFYKKMSSDMQKERDELNIRLCELEEKIMAFYKDAVGFNDNH
jgi:hypothetical protein